MARKKRYSKILMVIDIILTLVSSGTWLVVVGFREWYMHSSSK